MKEPLLKKTFHTMTEAFQNCWKRFPITVCFVFVLAAYLAYLVATDMEGDRKQLMVLGYYFSIGMLLSLTLHLWSEEIKSKLKSTIVHVVMHVLLIADAVYLYSLSPEQSLTEIGIAHGAGILALWLSVFFLSFTKEKNDIPSWNFTSYTIGTFVTANVVGLIMSGGISLLVFSLQKLFNVDVSWRCYLYILIICSVLLPMLLFLGMLPKDEQKHDREPQSSDFLKGTIHFLFLPLIAGYLLVLYIYAARILISWELPIGWVSWLVVALMAGCIATEFGLYPARIQETKRANEWIARWLPALVLPLLVLMTVGIMRRFNDYGITINRLYIITLNIWFYIVCFGLVFTKARRISWIPISFSIIFLLTSALPVNYASITRNTIRNDVKEELKRSCDMELPLTREQYNQWIETLPEGTAAQVNDKFMYLRNWFGRKSIADLVDRDVSFYSARHHYETDNDDIAVDAEPVSTPTISYRAQAASQVDIKIPNGYNRFIAIPDPKESDWSCTIPRKYLETGILSVSLGTRTGHMNDSVYIDLKTLETFRQYKYGEMPPTTFKCNSNKNLFMLTRFSLNYPKVGQEELKLGINGYLFKK
ncbi:DUF4153 domain-containing protein [Bacteroides oleiciplenus]|uniref:DUF4153 domain-containing protein n=1 Tax=Bacteroides oleiciplenus TaxID=626931 RepID=UPI0026DC616F|nr:DUF4153 domain-containing protein [Bacteroides oleiciplenus]